MKYVYSLIDFTLQLFWLLGLRKRRIFKLNSLITVNDINLPGIIVAVRVSKLTVHYDIYTDELGKVITLPEDKLYGTGITYITAKDILTKYWVITKGVIGWHSVIAIRPIAVVYTNTVSFVCYTYMGIENRIEYKLNELLCMKIEDVNLNKVLFRNKEEAEDYAVHLYRCNNDKGGINNADIVKGAKVTNLIERPYTIS